MSVKPLYNFSGVPQLILKRTQHNETCFFVDKDYMKYLELVHQYAEKFHCHIHAYAIMPDHIYLLATSYSDQGIPQMMQSTGKAYADYVSKTYAITETLWKAGYKSCVIESEQYLFQCMQYIESAPLRAALVAKPDEYCWSSYRYNALINDSSIITPHTLYMALEFSDSQRLYGYQKLQNTVLDEQIKNDITVALSKEGVLGSEVFKETIRQKIPLAVIENNDQWTDCVMFY